MLYTLLADGLVTVHFLWILFLIFGGIWGRRRRRVRLAHVPALAFACLVELLDWYCPLTRLEVWLRERQGGRGTYAGSFIPHYLERIVYADIDRRLVAALTVILCGFNCWLYFGAKRD